jgi:hypothetical protein
LKSYFLIRIDSNLLWLHRLLVEKKLITAYPGTASRRARDNPWTGRRKRMGRSDRQVGDSRKPVLITARATGRHTLLRSGCNSISRMTGARRMRLNVLSSPYCAAELTTPFYDLASFNIFCCWATLYSIALQCKGPLHPAASPALRRIAKAVRRLREAIFKLRNTANQLLAVQPPSTTITEPVQ